MILENAKEPLLKLLDWTAIGTAIGTLLEMVPHITGLVGLVWMCVRLYQEPTVQNWLKKRKEK